MNDEDSPTTAHPGTPGPSSLLVKPVGGRCNLRCAYCFYRPEERGDAERVMRPETLRLLTQEALRLETPRPSLCWQGGEPTLAGPAFYKDAVALQRKLGGGREIANSLQTNGLAIDRQWAAFLRKHGFLVGLSLDGPRDLHDAHRRDPDGAGTWRRVMDAAGRLRDAGVPVNILCSVTALSAGRVDELFAFFTEQGFEHVQFTPIMEADGLPRTNPAGSDSAGMGPASTNSAGADAAETGPAGADAAETAPAGADSAGAGLAGFSLSAEAYGKFLCRLWDLWTGHMDRGGRMGIRFFESFCHRAFGLAPTLCEMYPGCGTYAVVEQDGGIYPCDFFAGEEWRLGNLEQGLLKALHSPKSRHFNELRLMLRSECLRCDWKPWCHGGCLKYRKIGARPLPRTFFCRAYLRFFAHARADLSRVAAHAMRTEFALAGPPDR